MASELGDRERRYLEAYLELEAHATAAPSGARERILAAALAEVEPPRRTSRPSGAPHRAWVVAGVGLCAAAVALAWWSGRRSVIEEHATRTPDQASLVTHGERPVHEASRAERGAARPAGAEPALITAPGAASPEAAGPDEPATPRATSTPSAGRRRPEPETTRAPELAEPEGPSPSLSDAEVALLERARRLAQQGEHAQALAVLRTHARSYPRSVLGPERVAEQVAVLCRMGAPSAEAERTSFMTGDPPQYLRSRVEKACAP